MEELCDDELFTFIYILNRYMQAEPSDRIRARANTERKKERKKAERRDLFYILSYFFVMILISV